MLAAIVPAVRPLRRGDIRTLSGLTTRLRSTPQFPAGGEITELKDQLKHAGFDVMESQRERYVYTIRSRDEATRLVNAL